MATKTSKTKGTKTTKAATPKAAPVEDGRLKSGRLSAKGMRCLCGCGENTATDGARFRTGHDARLKGVIGRLAAGNPREGDAIPVEARPFLAKVEGGMVGYSVVFQGNQAAISKIAS